MVVPFISAKSSVPESGKYHYQRGTVNITVKAAGAVEGRRTLVSSETMVQQT
jgi:hypothetical protein